jgi:hypothetical protein
MVYLMVYCMDYQSGWTIMQPLVLQTPRSMCITRARMRA